MGNQRIRPELQQECHKVEHICRNSEMQTKQKKHAYYNIIYNLMGH